MKHLLTILFLILFINSYYVESQISFSVDKWREYVDELAGDTDDEARIETLYADLSYRTEHPYDLNRVTEEELKTLPFLSDLQIRDFLSYRLRTGTLLTLYELKNLPSFDYATLELLLPFVHIGEFSVDKRKITVKNLLKYNSNELQLRYDRCFQQKKGYASYPDSVLQRYPNRAYWGEPFYTSLRYSYAWEDRIQAGIVAEKDAGEPFWNTHHKGYDFYSIHLVLKDFGWLKNLSIGDYKVSFGQGLVISHDFSPGRNALITQVEKRTFGFRRHFSTDETDFLRGIAFTLTRKAFDLSFFYSNRKMDAAVDSLTFPSIKTDGLHRVQKDWEKRRTVSMRTCGGSLQYASPDVRFGLTALSYSFGSFRMQPDPKPYNLYYFRGNRNVNLSVNYLLKNGSVKLYGETAVSANGALATLNALELTPASYISFLALYRNYSRRYQAFFGNAFAQNSTLQNEKGVYMGFQIVPLARWKIAAYLDFFRFPWLKYGVDAPSAGQEYSVQADYTSGPPFSASLRYQYARKEKNQTSGEKAGLSVDPYIRQRLRGQVSYRLSPVFSGISSANGLLYREGKGPVRQGILISQRISWKPFSLPFEGDGSAAWFRTDDSATRLSVYEKNLLYAFNRPSFYGRGIRVAASFRWNIGRTLSLSVKIAHTHYTDRDQIGTDAETIEGSDKTDIYSLIRWKF